MNGVIPVADIVGPPLAGFVADRIGNFRYNNLLTVCLKTNSKKNYFQISSFLFQGIYVCVDWSKWVSKFITNVNSTKD